MAQLGYLPMTWKATLGPAIGAASARAQLAAAYRAPAGTFTWQGGWPWALRSQWNPGKANILQVGAIRAFESVHQMTMDGIAGKALWSRLFTAVAKVQKNPNGYTYALANQHYPEKITIWHNGKVVLTSLANTGIPGRSTVDGTFPVYLKYYFTYMDGTNPDGSKYHDPVYFANYFNGGDAVHEFARYSYGSYQSLGCVELPWAAAKKAYGYLSYGSLVTATGPGARDPGGQGETGRSLPGPPRSACSLLVRYVLDRVNFFSLRALGTAASGVLDPLVLLEGAEPVHLDGGVVDEDVGRAVVRGDETVAP